MVFDLFLFSLFLLRLFFIVVCVCFYFRMFFCSYGTAENKYLKVPQIRDNIVVEFKVQLTLRYGVTCARVWLWPQSSAATNPAEKRTGIFRRLTRGNRLESLSSSRGIKFLPTFVVFFFFCYFAKNVFEKHLCILKSTYCSAHLWRKKQTRQSSRARPTSPPIQYSYRGCVTLLIVSAFLVKHSVSQQNLPFQTRHWELHLSISQEDSFKTVFTLYNLLKILLE